MQSTRILASFLLRAVVVGLAAAFLVVWWKPALLGAVTAPVRSTARFAKYGSMAECFAARDHMIASLPAYQEARAAAQDPEAFVCAFAPHWATDPGYAEKVLYVYRVHALDRLDEQSPVTRSQSPVAG